MQMLVSNLEPDQKNRKDPGAKELTVIGDRALHLLKKSVGMRGVEALVRPHQSHEILGA